MVVCTLPGTCQQRERINADSSASVRHQLERAMEDSALLCSEMEAQRQGFEAEKQTLLGRIRDLEELPAMCVEWLPSGEGGVGGGGCVCVGWGWGDA